MSQIVEQTMSVRSGNTLSESFIFIMEGYARPIGRCYFAFARFSATTHEVVCNPSFEIKAKPGISSPWARVRRSVR